MGSRELLTGFLWRARAGVRADGLAVMAGHGMADAAYRPPALPYVSVVGPLTVELEPERDLPRVVFVPVQSPGYLAGASRGLADPVPDDGQLRIRADGDVVVTADVVLGPLAGQTWAAAAVGPAVAEALQTAVRAGTRTVEGVVVTDVDRVAELDAMTVRWDAARRRLVVASGRRGVITGTDLLARQPSSVEPVEPAGPMMAALGLAMGGEPLDAPLVAPGRVIRHRRPTPTAVALDVRVDLWAGSQSELAEVLDAWTRITATRGQLLVQPAVLASDVAATDTSVRLLAPAEPLTRTTLVALDVIDATLVDRVTGGRARLRGGAAVADGELALSGTQGADLTFFTRAPVPSAWEPDSPTRHGYAATVGLRAPALAMGDSAQVLTIRLAGRPALTLGLERVAAGVELRAAAARADAGTFAPASGVVTLPALQAGIDVHVSLDARRGSLTLAVDGQLLDVGGPGHPGPPVGGPGMQVVVGAVEGAPGNTGDLAVRHVHVHSAPVGAPDPRLRQAAAPASAWSPGDPFVLARSQDGVGTSGDGVPASVVGVQGDRVLLDRPVGASFPRASSIAFRRSEFFSQRTLRRSDDLMNQLYRISAEYRVSTLLDEPDARVSAPLVESVDIQTRDFAQFAAELAGAPDPLASGRPAGGAPGTTARFADNPTRTTTSTGPSTATEESHA